ncbi:hypothetical protein AAHB65_22315 [Bacillus toyonensis]
MTFQVILKDSHYKGAESLGRGIGYLYPHDHPNGWVHQQYLPDKIKNKQYYKPKTTGKFEQALSTVYERLQSSNKTKNKG